MRMCQVIDNTRRKLPIREANLGELIAARDWFDARGQTTHSNYIRDAIWDRFGTGR